MTPRFPTWILLGAVVLACGYLPTLRTPFDFIDDGNLVYPAQTGTSFGGHVALWWEKVVANYEHLGPFRPVLWAHWELFANVCGGEALPWRIIRFVWCGLSAGMLLWLFRELRIHPVAALIAGACAMWNPYRNEIWTSLTLAEGVAMPYALLGLIAARKAAHSTRPVWWDLVSVLCVMAALGCKNTYTALIPAQMALRLWTDGLTLREAWHRNRIRSLLMALTIAIPLTHYIYFKLHWHAGQYETHAPTVAQFGRIVNTWKGAIGLDFLGIGFALALGVVVYSRRKMIAASNIWATHRAAIVTAALLLLAGVVVYLPMSMMSGRYAMPGVWGLDILIGLLLTSLIAVPASVPKKVAWAAVWVGVMLLTIANVGRQEKFAARARMLWDAIEYVEATAPPGTKIAWYSGTVPTRDLNVEEGIHFRWHLLHRGRSDASIGLFDLEGHPLDRVEITPFTGEADYRFCGTPTGVAGWSEEHRFAVPYWVGRKQYECHLGRRQPSAVAKR